ncbi:MAG: hypothetical protein K2Q27_08985 [Novosphingobium sp.]|uniref:hypothetical protein n=1 Tax=unclassified Novosphingobium TaxID=2644732 RepID=UPI0006B971E4|nr:MULTISPECIES: hypothetical protein [unclassified Novosphingobium]KPF89851.1 hypothetical protein IP83_00710 [Novosphingobium sp. AAP93]MBY0393389.1 hypothetical protein [Novosphingobium sp.]
MKKNPGLDLPQLFAALEVSDIAAINGIASLANILRLRGLLSVTEASALHQSMSLPLGLPRHADNLAVQELQAHLDDLFAHIIAPD